MRATHGRAKIFTTPQDMWEAACEYFQYCEDNPLISIEYNGGKRVRIPKMQAFTMQGLCLFLDCNTKYFNDFEAALDVKNNETHKDFSEIVTRIRETIYSQKFRGAAAGFLNANIIARDLGLADKSELRAAPSVTHTTVDLTPEQIRSFDAALEGDC